MEEEMEALRAFMMFRKRRTSEFDEYEKYGDIVVARLGRVAIVRNDEDVYIFVMKNSERAKKLIELVLKLYSIFNDVLLFSIADNIAKEVEYDELSDDRYEYTFVYE